MRKFTLSEFSVPAFLALAMGLTLSVALVLFHQYSPILWFLPFYLLLIGGLMAFQRISGTLLMAAGIVFLVWQKITLFIGKEVALQIPPLHVVMSVIGQVLFLAFVVLATIAQLQYFRNRGS